jgi:hypothetical protein
MRPLRKWKKNRVKDLGKKKKKEVVADFSFLGS